MIGEREAVHRAMSMSELVGAPIVLVHISAREVIEQIDWARRKGLVDLSPRPARNTSC